MKVLLLVKTFGEIDFFTSATGNFTKEMKSNACVSNFGRLDKEIDRARVEGIVG